MLVECLLNSPVLKGEAKHCKKSKDEVRDLKATDDRHQTFKEEVTDSKAPDDRHQTFKEEVRDSKATEDRQRIFQMFNIQKGVCFCNNMPSWAHLQIIIMHVRLGMYYFKRVHFADDEKRTN